MSKHNFTSKRSERQEIALGDVASVEANQYGRPHFVVSEPQFNFERFKRHFEGLRKELGLLKTSIGIHSMLDNFLFSVFEFVQREVVTAPRG